MNAPQLITQLLKARGPMTVVDIAAHLDKTTNSTNKLLYEMRLAGKVFRTGNRRKYLYQHKPPHPMISSVFDLGLHA